MAEEKIYRYFLPLYGGSADDAFEVKTTWTDEDPEWIAEDAAQDYWSEHDGCQDSWPKLITVILSDGSERAYSVEVEHEPTFAAYEQPITGVGKEAKHEI